MGSWLFLGGIGELAFMAVGVSASHTLASCTYCSVLTIRQKQWYGKNLSTVYITDHSARCRWSKIESQMIHTWLLIIRYKERHCMSGMPCFVTHPNILGSHIAWKYLLSFTYNPSAVSAFSRHLSASYRQGTTFSLNSLSRSEYPHKTQSAAFWKVSTSNLVQMCGG